ncbi:MAG: hypothetical protein V3U72_01340 [Candidatus Aenigmarchaeota archaeon]
MQTAKSPSYFVKGEERKVAETLQGFFGNKYPGDFKKFAYIDSGRWPDEDMQNREDVESVGTINGMPDLSGKSSRAVAGIMSDIIHFNAHCRGGIVIYKSRPREVRVIPVLTENGYTFDEKALEEMGLPVSERVFV